MSAAAKNNGKALKPLGPKLNSNINNNIYKSSNAEVTEEEEEHSYNIIDLSTMSPINKYQLIVINNTSNDLIYDFLKELDVSESISKQYISDDDEVYMEKDILNHTLTTMIDNGIMCKRIYKDYVIGSISNAHIVLVIRDPHNIYGFAVLMLKESSLYIDLICSNTNYKYVGTTLMFIIKNLGRYLGMIHIELMSVPRAIDFYRARKFKETEKALFFDPTPMKRRLFKKLPEENIGYAANIESSKANTYKNIKGSKNKTKKVNNRKKVNNTMKANNTKKANKSK